MDLHHLRERYDREELRREDLSADPIAQFLEWMESARHSATREPNAMCLATSTLDGQPSNRMVLVKEITSEGLIFFSNYHSRKGLEINANPRVSGCFWWPTLERQVRIEGRLEKIAREASERYFLSRPRSSQQGAIASPQSEIIADRTELERRMEALDQEEQHRIPAHWGGYLLRVDAIEFWQGRPDRLHDRFRYRLESAEWRIVRLAP